MINNAGSTSSIGGAAVTFVSWNVKGMNGPVKRSRIFSHLKQLKTDVFAGDTFTTRRSLQTP